MNNYQWPYSPYSHYSQFALTTKTKLTSRIWRWICYWNGSNIFIAEISIAPKRTCFDTRPPRVNQLEVRLNKKNHKQQTRHSSWGLFFLSCSSWTTKSDTNLSISCSYRAKTQRIDSQTRWRSQPSCDKSLQFHLVASGKPSREFK
jgi:hypothetical protein